MATRRIVGVCVAAVFAAGLSLYSTSTPLLAQCKGNSSAAQACQHDAWQLLLTAEGQSFKNHGACVKYAAKGGTLVPNAFVSTCASLLGVLSIDGSTVSCHFLPDEPDKVDYILKICSESGGTPDDSQIFEGLAICRFDTRP